MVGTKHLICADKMQQPSHGPSRIYDQFFSLNLCNLSLHLCRYEMVFKQAVTTEDMYLQMTGRNPSTASCEDLVVGKS